MSGLLELPKINKLNIWKLNFEKYMFKSAVIELFKNPIYDTIGLESYIHILLMEQKLYYDTINDTDIKLFRKFLDCFNFDTNLFNILVTFDEYYVYKKAGLSAYTYKDPDKGHYLAIQGAISTSLTYFLNVIDDRYNKFVYSNMYCFFEKSSGSGDEM